MREIRVLWFEDEIEWQKSIVPIINKNIKQFNSFIRPVLKSDVDEFMEEIKKDTSQDKFSNYDIIIVDYNLSGKNINGSHIIEKLSRYTIYGDMIFYSENSLEEIKNIFRENVGISFYESIYITERKLLLEKIAFIVERIYHRSNDLAYARGNILDQSAEIEFLVKELGIKYYQNLIEEDRNKIFEEVNKLILKTNKDMNRNFKNIQKSIEEKDIRKVLDSIFYALSSKQKFDIVCEILKCSNNDFSNTDELIKYFKNMISIRNNLAHKKIVIPQCGNYLIYFDTLEQLISNDCNCDNHNNKGKISKVEYDDIVSQNIILKNSLNKKLFED